MFFICKCSPGNGFIQKTLPFTMNAPLPQVYWTMFLLTSSSYPFFYLYGSGVDETSVTVMTFPNNAIATLTCSITAQLQNEVEIRGTKGHIKVHAPFWSPTKLEVSLQECKDNSASSNVEQKTEIFEYPLPKTDKKFNFVNSAGFRYQAECVRQCLIKGHKECPLVSHKESLLVAEILTKARHDLGYHLAQDME